MKTISEYCESNILVIPQALFSMKDAEVLLHDGNSAIFYKNLADDLTDVEFYSNTPCVVYIESGREIITTSDNKTLELCSNTAVFLPRGVNLHSDYVKSSGNLKAYLVFFEDDIISTFLTTTKCMLKTNEYREELFEIKCCDAIGLYFQSIQLMSKQGLNSVNIIKIKLLEFLHLLSVHDDGLLREALLSKHKTATPKRNLARLLSNTDFLHLSINDLAHLSGRSISSFTRDFKAIYGVPPKRWLQEKRLSHARELLSNRNLSVTHVASEVGYENTSHFIKLFKKRYQVTPKQFK